MTRFRTLVGWKRLIFSALVSLMGAGGLVQAQTGPSPCPGLKAERDRLRTALERIQADRLPEEVFADLDVILVELIDFLGANQKDQAGVQKRIAEIQERLPESEAPIIRNVNQFLKSVSGGLGMTADKQKEATEFLQGMQEKLHVIQSAVAAGNETTAKRQIEQFANFFDGMRKAVPGIDKIPGLNAMFQAYSDGIRGIAISAGTIDQIVARNNESYRAAGLGDRMYLRAKTPRERRAEMIQNVATELETVQGQIDAADCDRPPAPRQSADEINCNSQCRGKYENWLSEGNLLESSTRRLRERENSLRNRRRDYDAARASLQAENGRIRGTERRLQQYRDESARVMQDPAVLHREEWNRLQFLLRDTRQRASVAQNRANRLRDELRNTEASATSARANAAAQIAREAAAKSTYFECARACWNQARQGNPRTNVPADVLQWERDNPVPAATCDPTSASAQKSLAGTWSGWGVVVIRRKGQEYEGTYGDTYGTGTGKFEFRKSAGCTYVGKWGESEERYGSFTLTVSKDGNSLAVVWEADTRSSIGPGARGKSTWIRNSSK